jgi:hypothetical protein
VNGYEDRRIIDIPTEMMFPEIGENKLYQRDTGLKRIIGVLDIRE